MAAVRPELRATETYTATNFLRLHTRPGRARPEPRPSSTSETVTIVTLEHLSYRSREPGPGGWSCTTIIDGEAMSRRDALFIARAYARENAIPVIYASHQG